MGGDIYSNNVTPGVYPKWSKMHLRVWCIGRMESLVLAAAARHLPQRAADGIRVAAARRDRRQKPSMRVRRLFVRAPWT